MDAPAQLLTTVGLLRKSIQILQLVEVNILDELPPGFLPKPLLQSPCLPTFFHPFLSISFLSPASACLSPFEGSSQNVYV